MQRLAHAQNRQKKLGTKRNSDMETCTPKTEIQITYQKERLEDKREVGLLGQKLEQYCT